MGGLLYGIDIGVIDPALPYLNKAIKLSEQQTSYIVAAVLAGSLLGSVVAGFLADWLGRKKMMVVSALMFVASVAIIFSSQSYVPLMLGRLLQGMSGGVIAVVVPLYLAESLVARSRGSGTAIFQFMLTFGIVLAAFVGRYFIGNAEAATEAAGTNQEAILQVADHAWRSMFLTVVYPGLVFLAGSFMVSESPRWLFRRGKIDAARAALLKSRTPDEAELEIMEMASSMANERAKPQMTFVESMGEIFTARKYVTRQLTRKDKRLRFPAFWEAGFDYAPDEDNGGNGLHALQTMLVQFDGSKILLLPAWPKKWDAEFKLHAPMQTTVEGVVRDGKMVELKVTPESRRKDIQVMDVTEVQPEGLIQPEMKATASNSYGGEYVAASAIDGDPQTRWACMARQGWLEVDLGKPMTFSRASISEAFSPRVQEFELQAKEGDGWKTFYKGTTLGINFQARFAPVTAQFVRLNVLQASDEPTIWEFQLNAR